ncbi:MAG: tRNA uridine-5-carboxymethylaminomethyl(34) synthesis enzyme MnmG [bacterium JZ-2024 1]
MSRTGLNEKYTAPTRDEWDVIVIGAGHAGIEAAWIASQMGCEVLLATLNLSRIGHTPCNPSVGGPGKGHIAREVDALGGAIGTLTDLSSIHTRILNESKGPAVRALRAQVDKELYQKNARAFVQNAPRITLIQDCADEFLIRDQRILGVRFASGQIIRTRAVVVTTGTFLRGLIHIGDRRYPAGRRDEPPSDALGDFLERFGFEMARFKTGTPPRVAADSVNWSKTERLDPPTERLCFSFSPPDSQLPQVPTYMTQTTDQTHQIIRSNLSRSAMYGGHITGTGARYCPSIEDKVVKFSEKPSHHIFLEPETLSGNLIYVGGASNSLPADVQDEMIHSIPGLENAHIVLYGYAIEYDVIYPYQLKPSLETRAVEGLFLAGQINGTSGYEEAAGQGWVAGANAALKTLGKPPLYLGRDQAYIGVMIDDLVTRGTDEPYRIFTARAEHRLVLRWDNADLRLTPIARSIGAISDDRWQAFVTRRERLRKASNLLMETRVPLSVIRGNGDARRVSLDYVLRRPDFGLKEILPHLPVPMDREDIAYLETEFKYRAYIEKENALIARMREAEQKLIPRNLNFDLVPGLSFEAREKLRKVRPVSLARAARVPGVRSSDITNLMIYLYRCGLLSEPQSVHASVDSGVSADGAV